MDSPHGPLFAKLFATRGPLFTTRRPVFAVHGPLFVMFGLDPNITHGMHNAGIAQRRPTRAKSDPWVEPEDDDARWIMKTAAAWTQKMRRVVLRFATHESHLSGATSILVR